MLRVCQNIEELRHLPHRLPVLHREIRENALKRGDSLREELATCHRQLKETGDETAHQEEYLQRIEQAIEKQNYTVAEDLLSRWRSHDIEDHFAIEGKDHLQEFLRDYDVYYKKSTIPASRLPRSFAAQTTTKKNAVQPAWQKIGFVAAVLLPPMRR